MRNLLLQRVLPVPDIDETPVTHGTSGESSPATASHVHVSGFPRSSERGGALAGTNWSTTTSEYYDSELEGSEAGDSVHGGSQFGDDSSPAPESAAAEQQSRRRSERRRNRKLHRARLVSDSVRALKAAGELSSKSLRLINPVNVAAGVSQAFQDSQGPNLRKQLIRAQRESELERSPSAMARFRSRLPSIRAIDPRSAPAVIFETIVLLAISAIFITVPVKVAFVPCEPEDAWDSTAPGARQLFILDRVYDAVFAADLVANFFMGFYHEQTQAWIMSLSDIWRRYLMSWFVVDALALVPFERFVRHGELFRLIKVAKLRVLVNQVRSGRLTGKFMSRTQVDLHVLEVVQHVYMSFVAVHFVCCCWTFILRYEMNLGEGETWATGHPYVNGFEDDGETPINWVAANSVRGGEIEYYVAAMQLLFQGEMQVTRLTERCLLVASMATFYSIFIFILTELVALIGELNNKGSKYRRMLRDLNGMMRDNAFPADLRFRLRQYLRFRHLQSEHLSGLMMDSPEHRQVLSALSPKLRAEAVLTMNKSGVTSVTLFKLAQCPLEAILSLSLAATTAVYAGHEFIYSAGDPAEAMNICVKGLILCKGRLLRKGETFGEEAAMKSRTTYVGSAMTITFTTVCHIGHQAITAMYKRFPATEGRIRKLLARQFAREGMRAYVQYVQAIRAGRIKEFRADFFNQGFSEAMLVRMHLVYSKSTGEFDQLEKQVTRVQRAWRGKRLRRRTEIAKYKARAERAGFGLVEGGEAHGTLRHMHLSDYVNLAKEETTEQRLDHIDTTQRRILDALEHLTGKIQEMDNRSTGMSGTYSDITSPSQRGISRTSQVGVLL